MIGKNVRIRSLAIQNLSLAIAMMSIVSVTGCRSLTCVHGTVPANRLPRNFLSEVKDCHVPVQFAALGQEKPIGHVIGPGDTLSVYVYGVLPAEGEAPILPRTQAVNQRYYPPQGSNVGPTTGFPVVVDADGSIEMPLLGRVKLEGMTIPDAIAFLKMSYREKNVIEEGRERILVSLITPRVTRIVVMRDDTPATTVALNPPGQVDHIHRGSGEVIDLPAYENDVLHALAATGGLPGTDAASEIWVFRRQGMTNPMAITKESLEVYRESYLEQVDSECGSVVRIPLTANPGEPVCFCQNDVVLGEGDVVYVPRREEYFYTGGLLAGAQIPLPRDKDVDVLEAIALAAGSTGGPLGASGLALASGTPGHMIKPSRVIILRELPDGEQIAIRVDLDKAMVDEKERIYIQSGDLVMLHFKPHEAVFNGVLNFVGFTYVTGARSQ